MRRQFFFAAFALAFLSNAANSQIIAYDNTTNFNGQIAANGGAALQGANTITQLAADRIHAVFGGPTSQWTFSVANNNPVAVTARPRVRFYDDDGLGGVPGTLLTGFSFAPIVFPANGLQLFNSVGAFTMPADGSFWAGITFDDNNGTTGATLAQMNNLGQVLLDPPTIGFSEDDFFVSAGAGSFFASNPAGAVTSFGGVPIANFGWQFQVVPEPGSMALMGVAAVGGLLKLRRKKKA